MRSGTLVTFFIIGGLVLGGISFTVAEGFNLPDPGLTPESPFYFLDIWDEDLRLLLTQSNSGRYTKYIERVQERLAETEKLAGRGVSATQKTLELYRADLPLLYATAERLGDKRKLADALGMALDHLDILDNVSERTDFEKKSFILLTKIFIIDQQLQTLSFFAKNNPEDALTIFGNALGKRMDRLREVAIDKENNAEALNEYVAYLAEADRARREWRGSKLSPDEYLITTTQGHEATLLGHVRDRLSPVLDEKLLLAVNSVRKISGKPPFLALP